MHQHEIEEEASERPRLREKNEWLPHLLTLGAGLALNVIVVAFTFGQTMQRVDQNTDDISLIRANASPAAAQAIGEIRVYDQGLDRRITNLEAELRTQRTEMMAYLQRIDQNVQDHLNGRGR
jgi:hypothetical protein